MDFFSRALQFEINDGSGFWLIFDFFVFFFLSARRLM